MHSQDDAPFLILRSFGEQIRARIGLLGIVGLACLTFGYLLAGQGIEWLLSSSFLPEGAEVVVLHPLEVVLLRLKIAGFFSIAVLLLVLSMDVLLRGSKVDSIRESSSELSEAFRPHFGTAILVGAFMFGFSVLGVFYSFEFVVPMLLDYLTSDAQSVGLTTTWQLEAWAGFIVSLTGASVLVFQTPLVIFALLRTELVSREAVSSRRREIWFVTVALSAFLSPPDPISLMLIALPVIILMEGTLIIDSMFSVSRSVR